MKKITVLLSSYNGEKYIKEQLNSIFAQTNVEVHLVVRDDGSTDHTLEILEDYSRRYSNMEYYIGKNKGPAGSFFDLIEHSYGSDYYALCDQDDVWDEDKLFVAIKMLDEYDPEIPLLYYSNLRVVDQDLNFFRMSHDTPRVHHNRYCALTEGLMTGCTGVFNEKLAIKIRGRIPKECSMHDTWIYMIAIFLGKTVYDFDAHISYRQHEGNVIGVHKSKYNYSALFKRIKRLFDRNLQPKYTNAKSFLNIYREDLTDEDREKIEEMASYKDNISSWLKLLFDRSICTTSIGREIRYRGLIILRII